MSLPLSITTIGRRRENLRKGDVNLDNFECRMANCECSGNSTVNPEGRCCRDAHFIPSERSEAGRNIARNSPNISQPWQPTT